MKWLRRAFEICVWGIIAFMAFGRYQIWKSQSALENTKLEQKMIVDIQGNQGPLLVPNEKQVLVFWATWCRPCQLELKRLNQLVIDKKIDPKHIKAISSNETLELVQKVSAERHYQFPVFVDSEGAVANEFHVVATPTLAFVEAEDLKSLSSGISILLESKLTGFLEVSETH